MKWKTNNGRREAIARAAASLKYGMAEGVDEIPNEVWKYEGK